MKPKLLLAASWLALALFFISCGGKDSNNSADESAKGTTVADDGIVPTIDTAILKDEPSILAAMQKVVDARLADDKKKNADASYGGHYLELTQLYTSVLKASTAYSRTLSDPGQALEFDKKITAIQDKMYVK